MFDYIIRRLFISILTLFVIVTITFFLMHTVPGGQSIIITFCISRSHF